MFRVKLIVLLLVVIGALVGTTWALSGAAVRDLEDTAVQQLKSSTEVVRLTNTVAQYSVIHEATAAASDAAVVAGAACPLTEEALRAARTPGPPTVGPDGTEIPGVPSTTCTRTAHEVVLEALKSWTASREELRALNEPRFLSERDPGFAVPRAPDLLLVTDPNGVVVARVGFDKDDWFGDSKPNMVRQYPVFGRVEAGVPQHDSIAWREADDAVPELAQVGVAPIFVEENGRQRFAGTVMVGYKLTDSAAEEAGAVLYGHDVAYFFRGAGDSVVYAGTTAASRPELLSGLSAATLHNPEGEATFPQFALQRSGVVYEFEAGGTSYVAMSSVLSKNNDGTEVLAGFIVTSSVSGAILPLGPFQTVVPALGAALALIGILGVLVAIRSFMLPIEDISKGVQEVIAGKSEYMWEVDERSHMSDLAHSLNVMSARLQGKRDPDSEDTEGDADWKAMAGDPSGGRGGGAKPAGIAGIGNLRGRAAATDEDEDDDE
ncbi:MAG: hypothetical protein H6700_07095 [Myxococcales bacterium]|nr:hypothetical protein [Myxococcales bacterium]MCB9520591.1 hypothetical protein [Myxococcales bacterium]MCB9531514.1 hypothetical protein [Myxococcales bacterium]